MDRVLELLSKLPDVASPAMVMGLIISSGYAIAFRALLGGRRGKLLVFLLASGLGFALGQSLPFAIAPQGCTLGEIRLVEASIGALALLFLARRLQA